MQSSLYKHTLYTLIINAWEDRFPLGTQQLLSVQHLLNSLPTHTTDEQVRNYLAALLVKNDIEQHEFYDIFHHCQLKAQELCEEDEKRAVAEENSPLSIAQKKENKWIKIFVLLLAILSIALLTVWSILKDPSTKDEGTKTIITSTIYSGDTLYLQLSFDPTDTLRSVFPEEQTTSSNGGRYFIDSSGVVEYIPNDETLSTRNFDEVELLSYYDDKTDTTVWQIEIIEPSFPDPTSVFSAEVADTIPFQKDRIESIPIPFPSDLNALRVDKEQQLELEWITKNLWYLKGGLILLLGLMIWAFIKWRQYQKAKVIATITQPEKAPYLWSPKTEEQSYTWIQDTAQPLLKKFRGRTPTNKYSIDLKQTVQNTIRQAGRVSFGYKKKTLPANFLLLIDSYSAGDHQSRIFEELYQEMLRAEIAVNRYFYQGDIRLCYNNHFPNGISLLELEHNHTNAQLIIIGEGAGLFSPSTGKLSKWTKILDRWSKRVLLSPKPIEKWNIREERLNEIILTLPATPQGLEYSIDSFISEGTPVQKDILPVINDALQESFSLDGNLIASLKKYFSKPLVNWIAACALWPKLSWDLTLYLGKTIEDISATELVNFYNLQKLFQLPWFKKGIIPERARLLLIDHLIDEGLERKIRLSIKTLLAQTPPPPIDSVAYEEYRMNVILNELRLAPDRASQRQLEKEFAAYLEAGKQPDFVTLQLLNRPVNRYDVIVGNTLKKFAFQQGLPGLGWQLWVKALALWLLLAAFILPYQYNHSLCEGNLVDYQDQRYCIKNDQDQLLLLRVQAAEAVAHQNFQSVDQFRSSVDSITHQLDIPSDSAFYLNTSAHYYNYAAQSYNCSQGATDNCRTDISPDSLKNIACDNVMRAESLMLHFNSDTAAVKSFYRTTIQRICSTDETAIDSTDVPPIITENTNVDTDTPSSETAITIETGTENRDTSSFIVVDTQLDLEVTTNNLMDNSPLNNTTVLLYEYTDSEGEKLVDSFSINTTNLVQFKDLKRGGRYVIKAYKNGFGPAVTSLDLSGPDIPVVNTYRRDLYLGQLLEFFTFDVKTELALPGAEVSLIDPINGDLIADKINPDANDFRFSAKLDNSYRLKVTRKGYESVEEIISFNKEDLEAGGGQITFDVFLEPIKSPSDMLPLLLYFDNDQPNPRTRRPTTNLEYVSTNVEYYKKKQKFIQTFTADMELEEAFRTRRRFDDFFNLEVRGGRYDLEEFTKRLVVHLNRGNNAHIELSGFSSPRADAKYNEILSLRRIDSVVNFFERYQDGILLPFVQSGQLIISRVGNGERTADPRVTDRLDDPKNSIYNLFGCLERRVEIRWIYE